MTWNNKLLYIVHLVGYFHSYICVSSSQRDVSPKRQEMLLAISQYEQEEGCFVSVTDNTIQACVSGQFWLGLVWFGLILLGLVWFGLYLV